MVLAFFLLLCFVLFLCKVLEYAGHSCAPAAVCKGGGEKRVVGGPLGGSGAPGEGAGGTFMEEPRIALLPNLAGVQPGLGDCWAHF